MILFSSSVIVKSFSRLYGASGFAPARLHGQELARAGRAFKPFGPASLN
jgi:hypothetical protein